MKTPSLPTREDILANGLPEGLVERLSQKARIDRAREMGAFLALAVGQLRRMKPRRPTHAGSGLASA